MNPFTPLQIFGVGALLACILIFTFLRILKGNKPVPEVISRRVVEIDGSDWKHIRVTLDCGHAVIWNLSGMSECPCAQ